MPPGEEKSAARSKRAVVLYAATLFLVVVAFIVLSYFMSSRSDSEVAALSEQNTSALQRIDTLHSEMDRLTAENEELREQVAALEEELRRAYLNWAEDTKQIEDRYKTDYNDLLNDFNELLSQLESAEE